MSGQLTASAKPTVCGLEEAKMFINYKNMKTRLSDTQNALLKPALACIQLGAGLYLVEFVKPYILPLVILSLGTVAVILLQAFRESS